MSKKMLVLTLAVAVASLAGSASGALIAWWPLNNSPNDQVGALNWTLTGGATYSTDCKEGTASLLCDGVDDRATLTGSGLMSAVFSTKTVALWFKANSTTKTQVIYDEGGGSNGWAIHLENDALEAAVCASSVKAILSTPFSSPKWSHVAISFDNGLFKLYLNGKEVASTTTSFTSVPSHTNASGLGATNAGNTFIGATSGDNFGGLIDDVRMYDQALSAAEIRNLCGDATLATVVSPENGATDVPRDAPLTWTAGETAGTHDVYFGMTFADVNTATRTNAKGVLAGQGQPQTTYAPAGLLAYGQTYYWRIDEANGTPDHTIFKGDIWSFTVEPYAYPIQPMAATASSYQASMEPGKTIDGSGLTGDLHGADSDTMWLSEGTAPNWIRYEFDKIYKLHQLVVWNSNQLIEGILGVGARKVTIETSTDGVTWAPVVDVPEFARAPGAAGYAANTTVSLGGVEAKYVKLTIESNWGGMMSAVGLAEVRFSYVPVWARAPEPADAATDVAVETALNWRPGREAASHQVYLGTDSNAVVNGTAAAQAVTGHSFTPASLNYDTTYYWKVNEVNKVTYPGNVWSFTTQQCRLLDDFESYTDAEGKAIFQTWADGLESPANGGSMVGNDPPPYAEQTMIHGGRQSMPLFYNNTATPYYSEATWTFDTPQDWTAHGIKSLSLWFAGVAGNTGQLYVKVNGTKVLYDGDATDVARTAWQVWNIDLSKAGNVKSVRTLAIGIDGTGAKGTLYVDDIGLYPTVPGLITPADPGTKGLVAWYKLDGDAKDSAGSHHGTLAGQPQPFIAGKLGQAFNVSADLTYITVPYAADLAMSSYTVAAWVNYTDKNGNRGILGTRFNGDNTFDLKVDATRIHGDIGTGTAWLSTAADVVTAQGGAITTDVWHHILYAVEPGVTRIYLDGALASTVSYTGMPLFMKSGQELHIGCSYSSEYMRGAIDEVRLYNRALSAAEAASLADRPGPVFQAP